MPNTDLILASSALSQRLGVEKEHMLATIKAQCFPNMKPADVSDTQLAAFVQVAQSLNLNPLLPGMVYAYPGRNGGIVPMIGPDGVFTLLASNVELEGWTIVHSKVGDEMVATATIKHKRLGDISYTAFISEWRIDSNPNWKTRPRHMLGVRALKHAARQIIHGIPFDPEEKEIIDMQEDPAGAPPVVRPPAPKKNRGAAEMKNVTGTGTVPDATAAGAEAPSGSTAKEEPSGAENPPTNAPAAAATSVPAKESTTSAPPSPPQPEGWPKFIEAVVKSSKEVEMTVTPAQATAAGLVPAKKMPTILAIVNSPEAVEAGLDVNGVVHVIFNPYGIDALATDIIKPHPANAGKPRWDDLPKAPLSLTLERWPSLTKPGTFLNVVTAVKIAVTQPEVV